MTVQLLVCTDDQWEPNNIPQDATEVEATEYVDLRLCEGDSDWFSVSVPAGNRMTAQIEFDNSSGNLDLELYNGDATNLLDYSDSNTSDFESVSVRTPVDDTFLIRVYGDEEAENQYNLSISFLPPIECTADQFEENDTASEAFDLTSGEWQELVSCPDDEDWYRVEVMENNILTATIRFYHDDGDLDLFLYDGTGTNLLQASQTDTNDEQIRYITIGGQAGFFLIKVANVGGMVNIYTLQIIVEHYRYCGDDMFEPNNSMEEAYPLEQGTYENLYVCEPANEPEDTDWYEFNLIESDMFHFEMHFVHQDGDLDVSFHDEVGAWLTGSTGTTDEEVIDYTITIPGRYYIQVYPYSCHLENGCPYTMTVSWTNLICQDDEFEPNDGYEEALPIEPGLYEGLMVCNEEDWFRLSILEGQQLLVRIEFVNSDGDLDMVIYKMDESQNLIQMAISESKRDYEEIQINVVESADYYIRVYPYYDGINTTYNLSIALN
jgi:hypothetical protein